MIYSCSGAEVTNTVSVGGVINGDTEHDQKRGGKTMLKKLFVTAAVAAAVSVPLAGVAWGEPANDNPIGPGGLPEKIAQVAGVQGTVPPGRGTALPHADPDTDPELASGVSDIAELPGSVRETLAQFNQPVPGQVIRAYTPRCVNGSLDCRP